ncbi:lipocalin family protein [Undibacterium sp. WLX3042]|uniref:lipocalin family protein n=2 Tax=unclassified Undibacterium TaxID=2630295 RepID=UPI003C2CF234
MRKTLSSLMKFLLISVSAIELMACTSTSYPPMPVVSEVNLQRYEGKWYQIALIPNRFQSMCVSDTSAEYVAQGDSIRVINRCRKADQRMEEAIGVAEPVAGSNNAKLRVSFFRPFYGDYWILDLDRDYQWVLVGEPSRKYGWILSRTPVLNQETLQRIWAKAESLGYRQQDFQISPRSSEK